MLRIKAILLLALFSLSVVGNAFEIHYCKGEVSSISFIGGLKCDEEVEVISEQGTCCHQNSCSLDAEPILDESSQDFDHFEKEDCCSSETVQVLNVAVDQTDRNFDGPVAIALVLFFPHLLFCEEQVKNESATYTNPDIPLDIPILFQSFLI